MKTKLFLFVVLITTQFSFSQGRTCGTEEKMQQILFNPILKKADDERKAKFEIEYNRLLSNRSNNNAIARATINIPVAVHFPEVSNTTSAANKACLRALAQTQIDVINADYNAANADAAANWPSASAFYPGVVLGNLDVNFQIATQNHPAGTGLSNGMVAVTFGTDYLGGADSDATWAGYMNFVVRDLGSGLLGYSPLRGSPSAGHTVVMNTWCFGTGSGCSVDGVNYVPQAPFNLGRTVTHELGHFFNLDHIFKSASASATNCGGQDADGVADTPKQAAATYGCIAPGSKNACTSPQKVLSMNYMDYSDDACMYMFTDGQKIRMLAYINTILSQYNSNVLSTQSNSLSNFSIYPNPNKGQFSISFNEISSEYKITILDASARVVYESNLSDSGNLIHNVQLPSSAAGFYIITISNGTNLVTKKLLVN